MKLHKLTWLLVIVGASFMVLNAAELSQFFEEGSMSAPVMLGQTLNSAIYFFYAGVIEFLARISKLLEEAADGAAKD